AGHPHRAARRPDPDDRQPVRGPPRRRAAGVLRVRQAAAVVAALAPVPGNRRQGGVDHPPHRQPAARPRRRLAGDLRPRPAAAGGAAAVPLLAAIPARLRVRAAVPRQPGPPAPARAEPGTHPADDRHLMTGATAMPYPFRSAARRLLPLLALLAPAAIAATPVHDATQLVVVTTPSWDAPAGRLQAYERTEHGWQAHGAAFDVALGRNGSAWGIGLHPAQADGPQKQEGDGRSPAGVFAIGEAFGYAPRIDSGMPYRPMLASDYCMDVPDSPFYNRIVD